MLKSSGLGLMLRRAFVSYAETVASWRLGHQGDGQEEPTSRKGLFWDITTRKKPKKKAQSEKWQNPMSHIKQR